MATAAKQIEPRRTTVTLPKGETAEDRRAFITESAIATVQLVQMVPCDEGGETAVVTDIGELPLGTKEIYTQRRLAGDYYCFIHGKRQVAATGDTLVDAFKNALAKAA